MADYEKLRKKREAEAMARLEEERRERRIKEEKQRQERQREFEQRRWDAMGLDKQKRQHEADIADSARKNEELVKALEEKRRLSESKEP
jgi:hypothetical protein